jgi:hypothetical protein
MTKEDSGLEAFKGLEGWVEGRLGRRLNREGVVGVSEGEHPEPLRAFRIGSRSYLRTVDRLADDVSDVVSGLSIDELFSVFGTYELGRVTLPHGISVWGPSLYYFGDDRTVQPEVPGEVRALSKDEMGEVVDPEVFWHCSWEEAVIGFGVFSGTQLSALATVRDFDAPVYEIGVDVAPGVGRRGLGRAVMNAAAAWILDQGRLILATTSSWNVPSSRLLRSIGLRHVVSDLEGKFGPFRVPPKALGKPLPDAEIEDHYPLWAQNQEIKPRSW